MKLSEVYALLDGAAPKALSDEYVQRYGAYDNSGLLVNTGREVTAIVFTLDLTNDRDYITAICALASLSNQLKNIAQAMIDVRFPEPEETDEESERKKRRLLKRKRSASERSKRRSKSTTQRSKRRSKRQRKRKRKRKNHRTKPQNNISFHNQNSGKANWDLSVAS